MPIKVLLEKLYARRRFGIKPGVDRVEKLLQRLGNPQKRFRVIHVAGTNGKGSTSAFLSSILLNAGHKVAQFSSPHLVRFTERFRINGKEYPIEKLSDKLETVLAVAPEEATFFEITTALAAYIFSEEPIDFAVMEAGMGGRSDATAAFDGEMTIITQIALDHTAYLGTTLGQIAKEKAGIIKPETIVISAKQSDEADWEIENHCRANSSILKRFGKEFSADWNSDGTLHYNGLYKTLAQLAPGITGRYQSGNAALALAAAEIFENRGESINTLAFKEGIANAHWPGRMELIPGAPKLLLDGAHNPAGVAALAAALEDYSYSRLFLVTGVCNDKDIEQMYAPLIPLVYDIYTVTPSIERALKDEELSNFFRGKGIKSRPCGSVIEGISKAQNHASDEDLILVCGSLFVVGEVKAWLEHKEYTGIRG